MGVVESQETKAVQKDSDKTVKTIFVEVEDTVKEGDKLFEYDTDEMELKLKQLELELTSINNSISTANQQIATLNQEKEQVPPEERIQYTSQIQNLQAQINQYNYDASSKQLEIDRQKASMQNSIVYSPMDGVIKSIDNDSQGGNGDEEDYYGGSNSSQEKGFISIMAKGDYRIKATGSELNIRSFSEGDNVIVRSRIDDTVWNGTISSIDLEHPESNNDNYYYGDSGTQATKYPFYIALETVDGLMLGQHVYVEMDYGQGEVKEGLWLDEFYLILNDGDPYVWAADSDNKIEKRKVTLGEYDESTMQYEILSGITTDDRIAFPADYIKEGMAVTENYEEVMDQQQGGDVDFDGDTDYDGDMDFDGDMDYDGDVNFGGDNNEIDYDGSGDIDLDGSGGDGSGMNGNMMEIIPDGNEIDPDDFEGESEDVEQEPNEGEE